CPKPFKLPNTALAVVATFISPVSSIWSSWPLTALPSKFLSKLCAGSYFVECSTRILQGELRTITELSDSKIKESSKEFENSERATPRPFVLGEEERPDIEYQTFTIPEKEKRKTYPFQLEEVMMKLLESTFSLTKRLLLFLDRDSKVSIAVRPRRFGKTTKYATANEINGLLPLITSR
ncbi:16957_t:CDS:2, partial [Funneliformis caledonium]